MEEQSLLNPKTQKLSLKGHYDFEKLIKNLNNQFKNNLNFAKMGKYLLQNLKNVDKNILQIVKLQLQKQLVVKQKGKINTPQKLKFAKAKLEKILNGSWNYQQELKKLAQDFNEHYGEQLLKINETQSSDKIKINVKQSEKVQKLPYKTKKITKKQQNYSSPVKQDTLSIRKKINNLTVKSEENEQFFEDQQ